MKCCCLLKTQSAQNIFVNRWCAINGQVLFLKVLICVCGTVGPIETRGGKRRMYHLFCFYSDVTESNRRGLRLICETKHQFCWAPLRFGFLKLHVQYCSVEAASTSPLGRFYSVKALHVDASSSGVALICRSACLPLFPAVSPFYVQCFKISRFYTGHAFAMYTRCCIRFPVLYLKSRKI